MDDRDDVMTPKQKEVKEKQEKVGTEQDQLLDRLQRLAIMKLIAVLVLGVVVAATSIVVEGLGDTVQELKTAVNEFGEVAERAEAAAIEARTESRAARAELNEAIRLVQENPADPGFVTRVEEGLRRIAEVDLRLERIEELLREGGGR